MSRNSVRKHQIQSTVKIPEPVAEFRGAARKIPSTGSSLAAPAELPRKPDTAEACIAAEKQIWRITQITSNIEKLYQVVVLTADIPTYRNRRLDIE